MPASGRPWDRLLASFKAECARASLPCWLCLKPIDYTLTGRQSQAFSADHVAPTSLRGDALRRANLKPAHYQRLQLTQRQHHARPVPHITSMVTRRGTLPPNKGVGAPPKGRAAVGLRGGDLSIRDKKSAFSRCPNAHFR